MGPLTLPTSGLIYVDASGLIYSVERVEPYRTLLEPMWEQVQDGNLTVVSSPILVIEALVKPLRDGSSRSRLTSCSMNSISKTSGSQPLWNITWVDRKSALRTRDSIRERVKRAEDLCIYGELDCRKYS